MFTTADLANLASSDDMERDAEPDKIRAEAESQDYQRERHVGGVEGDGRRQRAFATFLHVGDRGHGHHVLPENFRRPADVEFGTDAVSVVGGVNNADQITQAVTVQDVTPMNDNGTRFVRLSVAMLIVVLALSAVTFNRVFPPEPG